MMTNVTVLFPVFSINQAGRTVRQDRENGPKMRVLDTEDRTPQVDLVTDLHAAADKSCKLCYHSIRHSAALHAASVKG